MILKVTDAQYNAYCNRLSDCINKATSQELKLLIPSVIHIQKHATNINRTWRALSILQDFNHHTKLRG